MFWIGAGLLAVGAAVYKVGNEIEDINEDWGPYIESISESLDKLTDSSARLFENISDALEQMKALPQIFQQISEETHIRVEMGKADAIRHDLSTVIKDERDRHTMENKLERQGENLLTQCGALVSLGGGGTDGLFFALPYIGVWAQSYDLLHKLRGTGKRFYGHDFHLWHRSELAGLSSQSSRLMVSASIELNELFDKLAQGMLEYLGGPDEGQHHVFEYSESSFTRSRLVYKRSYKLHEITRPVFMLKYKGPWLDAPQVKVLVRQKQVFDVDGSTGILDLERWGWRDLFPEYLAKTTHTSMPYSEEHPHLIESAKQMLLAECIMSDDVRATVRSLYRKKLALSGHVVMQHHLDLFSDEIGE